MVFNRLTYGFIPKKDKLQAEGTNLIACHTKTSEPYGHIAKWLCYRGTFHFPTFYFFIHSIYFCLCICDSMMYCPLFLSPPVPYTVCYTTWQCLFYGSSLQHDRPVCVHQSECLHPSLWSVADPIIVCFWFNLLQSPNVATHHFCMTGI